MEDSTRAKLSSDQLAQLGRAPAHHKYRDVSALFRLANNTGVSCYFNAMIQSLGSLSSFVAWLKDNKDRHPEELWTTLCTLLIRDNNLPTSQLPILDTIYLHQALVKKRSGSGSNISINRQEDIQEGLLLLLDSLSPEADKVFRLWYLEEITCVCGHREQRVAFETVVAIELDTNPTTPEQFADVLKSFSEYREGHRCDKCSRTNGSQKFLKFTRTLIQSSEVIVVYYKKYASKQQRFFPVDLDLEFKDYLGRPKRHSYQIVAQVEHRGTMRGGHYWARVKRPKPPGYQARRTQMLKERLEKEPNNERVRSLLKDWEEEAEYPCTYFHLNDSELSFPIAGVLPTEETYMVFYHLFKE